MSEKTKLTPQEFAIRVFQMLQDYSSESMVLGTTLLLVKMLTNHPIEHAVFFASGDAFKFGGLEFDDSDSADEFMSQLSEELMYAVFFNHQFHVFKYPHFSRVLNDWVFIDLNTPEIT